MRIHGDWWGPEDLNLSAPTLLFHSRRGYSPLERKGPIFGLVAASAKRLALSEMKSAPDRRQNGPGPRI